MKPSRPTAFAILATAASLALGLGLAPQAQAASVTINLTQFAGTAAGLAGAKAAQTAFLGANTLKASESFEGFVGSPAADNGGAASHPTTNPVKTAVGNFSSKKPDHCGGSCVTPSGDLQVRAGNLGATSVFGRFNTTAGGLSYLDSNDNSGMKWKIPGDATIGAFDMLSFLLTDVDDVGKVTFNITAEGDAVASTGTLLGGNPGNGKISLVTMLFDASVANVTVGLNIDKDDGFGIDDIEIGASPVPLPAAGLLLLGGLGGLGLIGRRKTT